MKISMRKKEKYITTEQFYNFYENLFIPASSVRSISFNFFRLLIQAHYDVNIKDYDGWTPLHAAAHWGKEEACRILVENLCDMEAVNKVVGFLCNPCQDTKFWSLK